MFEAALDEPDTCMHRVHLWAIPSTPCALGVMRLCTFAAVTIYPSVNPEFDLEYTGGYHLPVGMRCLSPALLNMVHAVLKMPDSGM